MVKGTVLAYSKINIGLLIGPKRDDGYHDIDSYFVRTSLSDRIEYELNEASSLSIEIVGNESYMEEGKMDLMEKAARAFSKETGKLFSLKLSIDKHIPTQAGLGGGSSDAAAVIDILSQHFFINNEDKLRIGETVGSDVPFFITGYSTARVRGRGERIEKSECPSKRSILFIFPDGQVSTKDAYKRLDSLERDMTALPDILDSIDRAVFRNDFELLLDGTVDSYLKGIILPGDFYSLSGSGSTWFILCDEDRLGYYADKIGDAFRIESAMVN